MLDNIKIGQYLHGNSWYYRLDPRGKLIFTVLFVVIIFWANNFLTYGIAILFTLFIVLTSGVPVKFFYRSLRPIFYLMMITFFINLFFIRTGDWSIEFTVVSYHSQATPFIYMLLTLYIIVVVTLVF